MNFDFIFALFGKFSWAFVLFLLATFSGFLGGRLSRGKTIRQDVVVCAAILSSIALYFLLEFRTFFHGDETIFAPLFGQDGIDVARDGIRGFGIDTFYMKAYLEDNYYTLVIMTKALIFLSTISLSFSVFFILSRIRGEQVS